MEEAGGTIITQTATISGTVAQTGAGQGFSGEGFVAVLALLGVVIMIAALLSGVIEKTGLPQVAVFILMGAAIGPAGLGLVDLTLDSPAIRVIATLSLTLVLFSDAVTLNIAEVRKYSKLSLLVLGPGTLLSAAIITALGVFLLGLSLPAAVILGAALASTDPVLLRSLLRRPSLPAEARLALRLESGLNDVVLLPIVLVAMIFLERGSDIPAEEWGELALRLFIIGPLAGVLIGFLAVAALTQLRRQIGVRRDYESLYSLGIAFTAFAAAEAVHGSGFLAAFAAGLTIAAMDAELCDCFIEYGETTGEMALLFAFVLFGANLIWSGFGLLTMGVLAFAVLVILSRLLSFNISLAFTGLKPRSRLLIAWFGPRGLSSLLLVLLPVFAGIGEGTRLFQLCSVVVLLSVLVHGFSPMLLGNPRPAATPVAADAKEAKAEVIDQPADLPTAPPLVQEIAPQRYVASRPAIPLTQTERTASSNGQSPKVAADGSGVEDVPVLPERITVDEVLELRRSAQEVIILDARSERSFELGDTMITGAVRIDINQPVRQANVLGLPYGAWLISYCT